MHTVVIFIRKFCFEFPGAKFKNAGGAPSLLTLIKNLAVELKSVEQLRRAFNFSSQAKKVRKTRECSLCRTSSRVKHAHYDTLFVCDIGRQPT